MEQLDEIIIMAMGPTWGKCPKVAPPNCEIWGVNSTYRYGVTLNRLFCMHDLKHEILLQRAEYIDEINKTQIPFYTAAEYPAFFNNVQYPLKEIYEEYGVIFFLNTMCYMLALAGAVRPKKVSLYGVDMRPDSGKEHHQNEKGCVEFWLGVLIGRGIEVHVPEESFLMRRTSSGNHYGYQKRADSNGLMHLVAEANGKEFKRFKLTPIDQVGEEIGISSIIEANTLNVPSLDAHMLMDKKRGEAMI